MELLSLSSYSIKEPTPSTNQERFSLLDRHERERMSQAPEHPFTQAASQGYGEFAATMEEEEQEEQQQPEGPQSPEPEAEEEDEELDEHGNDCGSTFFFFFDRSLCSSRFHSNTRAFVPHGNRFSGRRGTGIALRGRRTGGGGGGGRQRLTVTATRANHERFGQRRR